MANEFMLFLKSQGVEDYNTFSTRKKQNLHGIFSMAIFLDCFNELDFKYLAKLDARQLRIELDNLELRRYAKLRG